MVTKILRGDEDETRKQLRISNRTFWGIVNQMPRKTHGWKQEFELLTFLYWFACGSSYRVVGNSVGISRKTVCSIVHNMLDFFINKMRHAIRFPTVDQFEAIGNKFCTRARTTILEKCLGAIDDTHIPVECPVGRHSEYINRKLFYSIQMQAVVDSFGKFIDVFVGFPGSVHDTRVLKNSSLYINHSFPPSSYYLIGDSGYPCMLAPLTIIIPYKDPTRNEKKFNTIISSARNVVECAFGIMKKRWRVLKKTMELKIKNCIKTVFVGCILHNICLNSNDLNWDAIDPAQFVANDNNEPEDDNDVDDDIDGVFFRDILLQEMLLMQN